MQRRERRDVAFDLRPGEILRFGQKPEDAQYVFGLFPIPTPGRMADCTDAHGGPAEAFKLGAARSRGDGTWEWMILGPGTHMAISELFAGPDALPRNEWIGANIVAEAAK